MGPGRLEFHALDLTMTTGYRSESFSDISGGLTNVRNRGTVHVLARSLVGRMVSKSR